MLIQIITFTMTLLFSQTVEHLRACLRQVPSPVTKVMGCQVLTSLLTNFKTQKMSFSGMKEKER